MVYNVKVSKDSSTPKGPKPAYLKFKGEMLEAFLVLMDSMYKKGDTQLLSYGKFDESYTEAADELKRTPDFEASDYDAGLANKIEGELTNTVKPDTPSKLQPQMKEVVSICSNYLAQNAEYNKDKGPAFRLLIKTMHEKSGDMLYQKQKASRTYGRAATELNEAKGLGSDHDDPNLSQDIYSKLSALVNNITPDDLKKDMQDTLDISSKYLSQCAVDEIERGPAFDILVKELERTGADRFSDFKPVLTNFAAAYILKSAPGLTSTTPDTATVPKFNSALHKVIDAATPKALQQDMKETIERSSNYLSGFVRDRGEALKIILKSLNETPEKELVKRNNYAMNYGTAAKDTETAPIIAPFFPVKDVANDIREVLSSAVESVTPSNLKGAMRSLVQDVSKHLSQPVALRSGVAGERYPLNFLAAVKKSLGSRPLFKYKSLGQTYSEGADVLKYAGPLESVPIDPKSENLKQEIVSELNRGLPARVGETVLLNMNDTLEDAAKHLAKVGVEKGEALDYLVNLMKQEGDAPIGVLQGYEQSYNDGARRVENSSSLASERVDNAAYNMVNAKLNSLTEKKPSAEHAKYLPDVVDETSKFLSAPAPETEAEKRHVLSDLMKRKQDEIFANEGVYKITYAEAADEVFKAPVGVTTCHSDKKKEEMKTKEKGVIPAKKLEESLQGTLDETSAYLTDTIKGRAEAMQVIHDNMKDVKSEDLINVGKFARTYNEAADMLKSAPNFASQKSSSVLFDMVHKKLEALPKQVSTELAKSHMPDTLNITSGYIAGVAAKECGLDEKSLAALGSQSKDSKVKSPSPDSDLNEENRRRVADEEERRRREEEERKRREEQERPGSEKEERNNERNNIAMGGEDDEREAALKVLQQQMRAKGAEIFYKQTHAELSHAAGSEWLSMKSPVKMDKSVKEGADTARLAKKFEKKLESLVKQTPDGMNDSMQDVIIESSRILSEMFVAKNYKALVREALISEMQKRGNEILTQVNGETETFFFAAQRLKKTKSLEVKEPCNRAAYHISKKLDDMIRSRSMARKLTTTMKEHIKDTADYISEVRTKPHDEIEAYIALLGEMEAAGDTLLIEGNIPKSYKDAAAYLRSLTTFEDRINRQNRSLQSSVVSKLRNIMANVTPTGYTKSVLDGIISDSAKLLVSYVMLQEVKTDVLRIIIEQMEKAGDNVLLRHGTLKKSFLDAAAVLRGKNTDQLGVVGADPVVARKIQIKLDNLMAGQTPDKYQALLEDVIVDTTMYLAVRLIQPHVIQVCKCMKSVFVQCELWCEEILRRVARPCCACSHHVSAQTLAELGPAPPGGRTIALVPCPSKLPANLPCPASKPSTSCIPTTSYVLHSTVLDRQRRSYLPCPEIRATRDTDAASTELNAKLRSSSRCTIRAAHTQGRENRESDLYNMPCCTASLKPEKPHISTEKTWKMPSTMCANVQTHSGRMEPLEEHFKSTSDLLKTQVKHGYVSRTPIVTTDQMSDWHGMMVSLMWNVQAWRDWLQNYIDNALSCEQEPRVVPDEADENWNSFQRKVTTESLQWRQYNIFSRQLTSRLALRYRDKQIVSPTRRTVKTQVYMEYQQEMLEIVNVFYRWTHWLSVIVNEANSLQLDADLEQPLYQLRWNYFKTKVSEHYEDWNKYNVYLNTCWTHKYKNIISEWLPCWSGQNGGPVWVISTGGAVPSGAVAAGVWEGEVTWLARTSHRGAVLPAALVPSLHCCLLYDDGAVHRYTKYQVMCNAEVQWIAWRAAGAAGTASAAGTAGVGGGEVCARAVRVASGVHVGRVHYRASHLVGAVRAPRYRCHVLIHNRSFAFNCYELLVLASE